MEKYYTPSMEELHVGFECEWQSKIRNEIWNIQICDIDLVNIAYGAVEYVKEDEPFEQQFRVKLLDKQDIEDENWICVAGQMLGGGLGKSYFEKDNNDDVGITLRPNFYNDGFSSLHVYNIKENDRDERIFDTLFLGKIKNKTEFKRLLTQLGVV